MDGLQPETGFLLDSLASFFSSFFAFLIHWLYRVEADTSSSALSWVAASFTLIALFLLCGRLVFLLFFGAMVSFLHLSFTVNEHLGQVS